MGIFDAISNVGFEQTRAAGWQGSLVPNADITVREYVEQEVNAQPLRLEDRQGLFLIGYMAENSVQRAVNWSLSKTV